MTKHPVGWLISDGKLPDTPVFEDGLVLGKDHLRGWAQMRLLGYRSMSYLELPHLHLADLHCMLLVSHEEESKTPSHQGQQQKRVVQLCNLSDSGVWVNEDHLARGQVAVLKDGDWICLTQVDDKSDDHSEEEGFEFQFRLGFNHTPSTLSTLSSEAAPPVIAVAEQQGDACTTSVGQTASSTSPSAATHCSDSTTSELAYSYHGAPGLGGPDSPFSRAQLHRAVMHNERDGQLQALSDLMSDNLPYCPMCGGLLDAAVQLQPCMHAFCATCLSNHLGSQLQLAVPLSCPIGCTRPLRVMAATRHRSRVDTFLIHGSPPPPRNAPLSLPHRASAAATRAATTTDTTGHPGPLPAADKPNLPPQPSQPLANAKSGVSGLGAEDTSADPDIAMMELIIRWAYEHAIHNSPPPEEDEDTPPDSAAESPATTPRAGAAAAGGPSAQAARMADADLSSSYTLSPPRLPPEVAAMSEGTAHSTTSYGGGGASLDLPRGSWPAPVRVSSVASRGTAPPDVTLPMPEAHTHRPYVDSPVFTSSHASDHRPPLLPGSAQLLASPAASVDSDIPTGAPPQWWPGTRHSARYTSTGSPSPRHSHATYRGGSSPHFASLMFSTCISGDGYADRASSYCASLPDARLAEDAASDMGNSPATNNKRSPAAGSGSGKPGPTSTGSGQYTDSFWCDEEDLESEMEVQGTPLSGHSSPAAAVMPWHDPAISGGRSFTTSRFAPPLPTTPGSASHPEDNLVWQSPSRNSVSVVSQLQWPSPGRQESPPLEGFLASQSRDRSPARTHTPPRRAHGSVHAWLRLGQGANSPSHVSHPASSPRATSDHTQAPTERSGSVLGLSHHAAALAGVAAAQMSPQVHAGQRPPMPRFRRRSVPASDIGSPLTVADAVALAEALPPCPGSSPRTASSPATQPRQPPAVAALASQQLPSSATRATPTVSQPPGGPQSRASSRLQVTCNLYTPDHEHLARHASLSPCMHATIHLLPSSHGTASPASTIAWPPGGEPDQATEPAQATGAEVSRRPSAGTSLQRRWLSRFQAADARNSPHAAHARLSYRRSISDPGSDVTTLAPPAPVPRTLQRRWQRRRSAGGVSDSDTEHGDDSGAEGTLGRRNPVVGPGLFKSPGTMHVLCALHEFRLPLDLSSWRGSLVERVLLQLRMAVGPGAPRPPTPVSVVHTLEMLTRLAWNSPEAKEALASGGAISKVMSIMKQFITSPAVQAAGCMALAGLVYGTGDVSLTNQWDIAKAMGVEALSSAMGTHTKEPMLQLAALMACVPLAVGNPMMQANITQGALSHILTALSDHKTIPAIQAKGMVLLGVLVQGEEPVLDAIRTVLLESHVPTYMEAALSLHGYKSDAVLWPCLFCGSLLSAEGKHKAAVQAMSRTASLLTTTKDCLDKHLARCVEGGMRPDDLIVASARRLLQAMHDEREAYRQRLMVWGASVAGVMAAAVVVARWWCVRDTSV